MTDTPRPSPSTRRSGYEPDEILARPGPKGLAITLYAVIRRYSVQLAPESQQAEWVAAQDRDLQAVLDRLPGVADPSVTAGEISAFLDRMTTGQPPSVTEGLKRALADSERSSTLVTALTYAAGPSHVVPAATLQRPDAAR